MYRWVSNGPVKICAFWKIRLNLFAKLIALYQSIYSLIFLIMMVIQHAQRNLSSLGKDSLFSLTEKGLWLHHNLLKRFIRTIFSPRAGSTCHPLVSSLHQSIPVIYYWSGKEVHVCHLSKRSKFRVPISGRSIPWEATILVQKQTLTHPDPIA